MSTAIIPLPIFFILLPIRLFWRNHIGKILTLMCRQFSKLNKDTTYFALLARWGYSPRASPACQFNATGWKKHLFIPCLSDTELVFSRIYQDSHCLIGSRILPASCNFSVRAWKLVNLFIHSFIHSLRMKCFSSIECSVKVVNYHLTIILCQGLYWVLRLKIRSELFLSTL